MKAHFFTGFPGFITSQLIRQLFKENVTDHVYALILPSEKIKAENEIGRILEQYPGRTIELIEGDITVEQLDLKEDVINQIKDNISTFWHLAAIYDLAVPRGIAWKVNVDGTRNVNEFVKQLPNLERYMYFSTAYVAGKREGRLLETELIRPAEFKNYYEETKYEAEIFVEETKNYVPTTIIRPGIVVGNSVTGVTIKFDGPYFFLNLIDKLKFLPFLPYIGRSTSTINVVPVDYIINAAVFLSGEPSAAGKTVHLTDPNPHPVQEVYRAMVKEMTGKLPKSRIPYSLAKVGLQIKGIRKYLGVEFETLDYLTWNATFDTTVAQELLSKSSIRCPDFIKILPNIVKFYNENKHNRNYHIEIK